MAFWEAAWCGNDGIVAIASNDPREGAWHEARLVHVACADGRCTTIYEPAYEIGCLTATPDGRFAAIVEACSSDRGMVAGDVLAFERGENWARRSFDTQSVDVTFLEAAGNREIVFAGVRDFEVAGGTIDPATGRTQIVAAVGRVGCARSPH